MAQRMSLQPAARRGVVAGILAALSSMVFRGRSATLSVRTGAVREAVGRATHFSASPNWLKGSLISGKTAPGARGG